MYYCNITQHFGDLPRASRKTAERHIVHLVDQVITVSVATVKLVNELAQAVRVEDWLGETMETMG